MLSGCSQDVLGIPLGRAQAQLTRGHRRPSSHAGTMFGIAPGSISIDPCVGRACIHEFNHDQEVDWAAKKILATNVHMPVEDACVECHESLSEGWPTLTWPEGTAKAAQDKSFRDEVVLANEIRKGCAVPKFTAEKVMTLLTSERKVQREVWSYNEAGFIQKFGVTAEQAGLAVVADHDEAGEPWKGIVVAPEETDEERNRRKVVLSHSRIDQYLLTGFTPHNAIRDRQGRDHFEWLRNAQANKKCRLHRGPSEVARLSDSSQKCSCARRARRRYTIAAGGRRSPEHRWWGERRSGKIGSVVVAGGPRGDGK